MSVKNKTVLIQRLARYPATATCIASAPLVPEPSARLTTADTFLDEKYQPKPRDQTAIDVAAHLAVKIVSSQLVPC